MLAIKILQFILQSKLLTYIILVITVKIPHINHFFNDNCLSFGWLQEFTFAFLVFWKILYYSWVETRKCREKY